MFEVWRQSEPSKEIRRSSKSSLNGLDIKKILVTAYAEGSPTMTTQVGIAEHRKPSFLLIQQT